MSSKVIHLIAAARPNFMKVAPLYRALARESWCEPRIVHTGQHYDANMSDAFFRDLRLPEPAHHLEVGSGTVLDLDAKGNICSITIEHASVRAGAPAFSFEKVAA